MSFFEVNGTRLFGTVSGKSDEAVVCVHGLFLGNSSSWLFPATAALGKSKAIHCYDLRGHGMSDVPASGYDVHSMANDLLGMMDAWRLEKAVLLGHSYGALVSLYFACMYPDRVERIVLVEPPYPLARMEEVQGFLALKPEAMVEAVPTMMGTEIKGGGRRVRKLLERLRALIEGTSIVKDMVHSGEGSFPDIEKMEAPVLVISGASSSCLEGAKKLSEAIPKGEHRSIAGGHYLLSENPEQVMNEIGRFLRG